MTEAQWDEVYKIREELTKSIRELVNQRLTGVDSEVEDVVREELVESVRFWK